MRVLIITGGECSGEVHIPEYDLCIAADSGFDTAKRLGIFPNMLIGDFDSIDSLPERYTDPETGNACEIIRHPAKKNETDTMLAAEYAIQRGGTELCILGGLGGRADHTMSNVFLLEKLMRSGISAILTDGENELRVIGEGQSVKLGYGEYRYFSTIALERAEISVIGCAYPLYRSTLERDNAYAVSNEPLECGAAVTCHSGTLLLVRSERIS